VTKEQALLDLIAELRQGLEQQAEIIRQQAERIAELEGGADAVSHEHPQAP